MLSRALALASLALLVVGGALQPARGQDEGGGSGGGDTLIDSTSAVSDATAVQRELISTDGSISVFKEARPGEGIDGFWWEYDAAADLVRLSDPQQREQPLEQLVDSFGFTLVIPDTIRALRDSITAVADSIIEAQIEINTVFDPKLTTTYREFKDDFHYNNKLDVALPMTRRGNVIVAVDDNNGYNRTTDKIVDELRVSTNFNLNVRRGLRSTLGVNFTDNNQERNGRVEATSDVTSLNGRLQHDTSLPGGILLNSSAGLQLNRRNYQTAVTEGRSTLFQPTWNTKATKNYAAGSASFDYNGNVSSGERRELRTVTVVDSVNGLTTITDLSETEDSNSNHKAGTSVSYTFPSGWVSRFNGSFSRESFQYISQADSVVGQQETRIRDSRDATLNLDGNVFPSFEVKTNLSYRRNLTEYQLESGRFGLTTTRSGRAELAYEPWTGARMTSRMERSLEDRDLRNTQAGFVDKKNLRAEYKQEITERVELTSGLSLSLDSFEYDDAENTSERDLRSQRSNFTVRYTPVTTFSTALKMDIREDQSVNINPARSGDNKTDFSYIITPSYTWKIGNAQVFGDFQANARYNVYDFDEDRNFLTRRFSVQKKWQHRFSTAVSTEVLGRYEFSDEGSFRRSALDGARKFARNREILRYLLDLQVLYSPIQGIRFNAIYRTDGDDQYAISGSDREKSGEFQNHEFSVGINVRRRFWRTIMVTAEWTYSQKRGDRVSEVDREFNNIRAQFEYQPFRTPGGGNGGSGGS